MFLQITDTVKLSSQTFQKHCVYVLAQKLFGHRLEKIMSWGQSPAGQTLCLSTKTTTSHGTMLAWKL